MFDTKYLNKMMDERSWLESILPHVNNEQALSEMSRRIADLGRRIVMQKDENRGLLSAMLDQIEWDEVLLLRLAKVVDEAFRREAKNADQGK